MRLSRASFLFFLPVFIQSWGAGAHPTRPGFISIPLSLSPSHNSSPGLPPTIVHQQHANRGIRRLELMRGSIQTPDHELLSKIQKRASLLPPHLQRRYRPSHTADVLARLAHSSNNSYHRSDRFATFKTMNNTRDQDAVTPAHKPTFPNTIGLDIQAKDIGYLGKVQIGTPPRDFLMLMDSGSADLWVGSENCVGVGSTGCGKHTFLGPNSSSSFNGTKEEWNIRYGTGAVSGKLAYDNIAIAGLKLKSFKLGVAGTESGDFYDVPFDGLVGLAKSLISQQKTKNIVETCHEKGLINHPIASYKLSRAIDGSNDGELTLGAMNPNKYNPKTLVTVPNVNLLGFWEAAISAVTVNGKDMGWKNRTAICDTGTSLIIAPQDDVDAIHKEIPGALFDGEAWTIPCNTSASFALSIAGRPFAIDSRDLMFLPIDPNDPTGLCTSGISPGSVGPETQWLVGDVFLKNVYMSTNMETDKISFAKLKN